MPVFVLMYFFIQLWRYVLEGIFYLNLVLLRNINNPIITEMLNPVSCILVSVVRLWSAGTLRLHSAGLFHCKMHRGVACPPQANH